ncbi:MAG: hypothetical protein IJ877_08070 [Candidatus Gastranaerophilales bacterium]|nr:hypothetical protein [Candidatus Gastranaerophilales bacterium]
MSVVINTNVDSLKIQGILTGSTNKLSESMQRMSSGLQINSAKDDAAGTVISARMDVQLNGNQICQKNVQNANAMLSTAEGNIDVVLDNVSRIRDLTLQAKNGNYSDKEIEAMQAEVKERIAEIDRVSSSSKFSQLQLFGDSNLSTNGATFQVGQNADSDGKTDNVIKADKDIFKAVTFSALTNQTGAFNLANIKAGSGSYANFDTALTKLDTAIDNLTSRKSLIGSAQNRLESAYDTLTTQYANLSSAKSIITDADIASEASKFTQNQILQQVSTSLLAQANQAPSIALSLL